MPTLHELAEKYGVDKLTRHSYIPIYEALFSSMAVSSVCEIGIGYEGMMAQFVPKYIHGASLLMWHEYWPDAQIYACDIREDTLINDPQRKIRSWQCDQSKLDSLIALRSRLPMLDVIIDDGSHTYEHQILTAAVLLPSVRTGGVYIIEDTYPDKGAVMASMFGGELVVGTKTPDDCLVVVRR